MNNENLIFIKQQRKKSLFAKKIKIEKNIAYIADNAVSVKKMKKLEPNKKLVVCNNAFLKKTTIDQFVKYEEYPFDEILYMLEKIIEKTAEKYKVNFPFFEICVIADPNKAAIIIEKIKNSARLFTVISEFKYGGEIYDELFFKYGIVIRQMNDLGNSFEKSTLIIKADSTVNFPISINIPTILLEKNNVLDTNYILPENIYAYDEEISEAINHWGGVPSLKFFNLIEHFPNDKTLIDITKKASEIFLL